MRTLSLAAIAATLASTLAAQTSFAVAPFASCPNPNAIAAGDLDSDGDNDLLTVHSALDTVCAKLNLGGGAAWSNAVLFTYPPGKNPTELVIGDLDGSGRPDYAVTLGNSGEVAIHLATGVWPGFAPPQIVPVGGNPVQLVTFDVEQDNDLDLAVLCTAPPELHVLRNTGGVFAPAAIVPLPLSPHALAAGNLNLGSQADIVIAGSAATGRVCVLTNTTVGLAVSFAAPQLFPCDFRPFGVVVADLNEDGYNDVATSNAAFSTATVLLNDETAMAGTTVMLVPTNYALAPGAINGPLTEIDKADFDCDGDVDLAIACNGTSSVAFLWNNGGGTGTFSPATNFPAGANASDLVVAEFSGDPWADVAVANSGAADVSVMRNLLGFGCCEHVFVGGISDGFNLASPPGPEDACPSPMLTGWYGAGRNFDGVPTCGVPLLHTFRGIPGRIKSATLRMRMRADCATSPNDGLALGFDGALGNWVWSEPITNLTGTAWTAGMFGGVSLDLGSLPGGQSLLQKIGADGRLDVMLRDDTTVDSIVLVVETCSRSPNNMSLNVSPFIFPSTVTWTASGAPSAPPGGVAFLIDATVGPGPFVPGGLLCLPNPTILAVVPTTAFGTAAYSLTLPAIAFPPCVTLSSQAIAWDGTFTVFAHSNTYTEQIFD